MDTQLSKVDTELCRYRPIVGFPGYCVGDDGSVWSLWGRGYRGKMSNIWRAMSLSVEEYYPTVVLKGPNGPARKYVHHLVLEAFVGPRPIGMEACHFPDRSHYNNRLCNLRWASHTENEADKLEHGTRVVGAEHFNSKLTDIKVIDIRNRRSLGESSQSIADSLDIAVTTVNRIVRRLWWKHVI